MGGVGEVTEVFCDVARDQLKNSRGLGFAEETGGVIVEGVLPAHDHVGCHGRV